MGRGERHGDIGTPGVSKQHHLREVQDLQHRHQIPNQIGVLVAFRWMIGPAMAAQIGAEHLVKGRKRSGDRIEQPAGEPEGMKHHNGRSGARPLGDVNAQTMGLHPTGGGDALNGE